MNDLTLKRNIPNIEVTTMNWEDKVSINNNASISLEAAQHWSARRIFDKNKALWGTFLISTPIGAICFIGDTGYNPEIFKNIGDNYNILVSLIPIGAFEPRWFMKDVHLNPEDAVLVPQDLKSNIPLLVILKPFN